MNIYEAKLKSVILHITNACCNRCPYCYAFQEDGVIEHADIKKLYKIIDILSENGVEVINLLGGDPALHPHVIEIAEYATKKGISSSLMSNTMEIKNCSTEKMAETFDVFEATIHGSSAEEHDSFCKCNGVYNRLTTNLKSLSKLGAKIGIALNIIPNNYDEIYSMIASLVEQHINISYIIIQRIIPFGAAENSTEYNLTKEMANIALENISRIHNDFNISITVEDPFPLCVINDEFRQYMHPCEWGFTKAALNGRGDLSRCGADPRYLLGNIFETPLEIIWQESPILESFRSREYLADRCKECPDKEVCGGGCPLSCEVSGDHGLDYLYVAYHKDYGD